MSRFLPLSMLAVTACGGLTPLGSFVDTDPGLDTAVVDTADPGTSDTGDPVSSGNSPVLGALTATEVGSNISIAFTASDVDGDLNGGSMRIEMNGTTTDFAIPADLATWDPSSGNGTVRVAKPSISSTTGCSAGNASILIRGRAFDRTGLSSAQQSTTFSMSTGGGGAIVAGEVGDTELDAFDGGVIPVPCSFTGNIHSASDLDIIAFAPSTAASVVQLSWTGSADYDITIYDEDNYLAYALVGFGLPAGIGANGGNTPESVAVPMTANTAYFAVIEVYSGGAGDYTLRVQ